jgi:hypothetical protein
MDYVFGEVAKAIQTSEPSYEAALARLGSSIPAKERSSPEFQVAIAHLRHQMEDLEQQRNRLLMDRARGIVTQLELVVSNMGLRSGIALFWRRRAEADFWEAKRSALYPTLGAGQAWLVTIGAAPEVGVTSSTRSRSSSQPGPATL